MSSLPLAGPGDAWGTDTAVGFGAFTLDLRAGQLRRTGTALPLRPKTWAVLLYLIRRAGSLVTKEELLDAVWPDVAVTPDTLNKSIGELRSALGDDVKQPRFIETVHRRGFRFLALPRTVADEDDAAPAAAGLGQPFVGREPELARLDRCLERACAGERQLVFVSGPAGVGKTALIDNFIGAPAVHKRTTLVGWGSSLEHHGVREAYMPLLEALERLAQGPEGARVVAVLRVAAPSWLVQMPWLAGDDPALLERSLQAARPERMLRECVALLEALAVQMPLVLVLEDLHWSDPSTVDLLSRIGQRREPARLLIVATYRAAEAAVADHPLASAVRTLRGRRRCVELALEELSLDAVREYLAARFPGAVPPPRLADTLHAHTDGHPLFLRAVIDHMIAQAWILDTGPRWSFETMPERSALGVPADARDMVALQIGNLGPADRRLLEAASIVGRDFAAKKLALALERPVDEVEGACEALARGERFLRPVAGGATPRYDFAHELYRQAVYEDVPPGRRQRLHLRIGQALEVALGARAAERAPDLAHHFERGGDLERAAHYLGLAARRVGQRAAPREASQYLGHALALLERLPESAARRQREFRLRVALAAELLEVSGPASDALLHCCERALALCEGGDDLQLRFEVLYALCHVVATRGDWARLGAVIAGIEELVEQIGSAEHRVIVDNVRCRVAVYQADFAASCRHGEAVFAAAAARRRPLPGGAGVDPLIAAYTHYALASWMLGHLDRARATLRIAEREAVGTTPFSRASLDTFTALIALYDGDAERVLVASDRARRLAKDHDLVHWELTSASMHGWARMRVGDVAAGIEEMLDAFAAYVESGACVFTPHMLAFLAEGHHRAGNRAAALEALERALQIADAGFDRSNLPELHRLKGEALLAGDDGQRAAGEACLQHALAVARACGARALALRAALSIARHWSSKPRTRQARILLADALDGFDADADSSDLRQARALLAGSTEARSTALRTRRRA